MKKPIHLIAALQEKDRGIGNGPDLLFRISADLKRFKELTTGNIILMGRKTFESIGKALPNRTNIVITRDKGFQHEGVLVVHSLEQALEKAESSVGEIVYVIGGGEIYNLALPFANELNLTLVKGDAPTNVFFPDFNSFKQIEESESQTDEKTGLSYRFVTFIPQA